MLGPSTLALCSLLPAADFLAKILTNFHGVLIKVVVTSDLTHSSSSGCQLAVKFIALFYQMT